MHESKSATCPIQDAVRTAFTEKETKKSIERVLVYSAASTIKLIATVYHRLPSGFKTDVDAFFFLKELFPRPLRNFNALASFTNELNVLRKKAILENILAAAREKQKAPPPAHVDSLSGLPSSTDLAHQYLKENRETSIGLNAFIRARWNLGSNHKKMYDRITARIIAISKKGTIDQIHSSVDAVLVEGGDIDDDITGAVLDEEVVGSDIIASCDYLSDNDSNYESESVLDAVGPVITDLDKDTTVLSSYFSPSAKFTVEDQGKILRGDEISSLLIDSYTSLLNDVEEYRVKYRLQLLKVIFLRSTFFPQSETEDVNLNYRRFIIFLGCSDIVVPVFLIPSTIKSKKSVSAPNGAWVLLHLNMATRKLLIYSSTPLKSYTTSLAKRKTQLLNWVEMQAISWAVYQSDTDPFVIDCSEVSSHQSSATCSTSTYCLIMARLLLHSRIHSLPCEDLAETICDEYVIHFKDLISMEFTRKQCELRSLPIQVPRNLKNIRLQSSLGGSHIGGSTLDMVGHTLPLFQRIMYYCASVYGIKTIIWMGAAAGSEIIHSAAKLYALGVEMSWLAFELQYCNELKSNVVRLLETYVDISLNRLFYAMGVSYTEWITPSSLDISESLFFTSAVIPPMGMAGILIKALCDGVRLFIIPERNLALLGIDTLGDLAAIQIYHKLSVKLSVSSEVLALMFFAVSDSKVLLLITALKDILFGECGDTALAILKKEAAAVAIATAEQLKLVKEHAPSEASCVLTRSKRGGRPTDDRPLPCNEYKSMGIFKKDVMMESRLPTVVVDVDPSHNNGGISDIIGEWFISSSETEDRPYPYGFKNPNILCHFISCFQLFACCLRVSKARYVPSRQYPEIYSVLKTYMYGKSRLPERQLQDLAGAVLREEHKGSQQDASEVLMLYFLHAISDHPGSTEDFSIYLATSAICTNTSTRVILDNIEERPAKVPKKRYCYKNEGNSHPFAYNALNMLPLKCSEYSVAQLIESNYYENGIEAASIYAANDGDQRCPICETTEHIGNVTVVTAAPKAVLIFIIQRFKTRFTMEGKYIIKKDSRRVTLDRAIKFFGTEYVLTAVIYHTGANQYKGHYFTAVNRDQNEDWFLLDDNKPPQPLPNGPPEDSDARISKGSFCAYTVAYSVKKTD